MVTATYVCTLQSTWLKWAVSARRKEGQESIHGVLVAAAMVTTFLGPGRGGV